MPAADISKARVCGQSFVGIKVSNPARAWMSVSLVSVICRKVEVCTKGRSPVQRSPTDCDVTN
jgi:hypothetical protein